jgi:hypothetical protein
MHTAESGMCFAAKNQLLFRTAANVLACNPGGCATHPTRQRDACLNRSEEMLWTIFVILLVLWLLGWVGFHALGAYIHILLVLALIVLAIQLFSGRRPVV